MQIKLITLIILVYVSFLAKRADNCEQLRSTFTNSKVSSYLHADLPAKDTLYLVENKFCKLNEKIGAVTIATVDEQTAINHKNYFKINSFTLNKTGKVLSISYPLEGAIITIQFNKLGGIRSVSVIER